MSESIKGIFKEFIILSVTYAWELHTLHQGLEFLCMFLMLKCLFADGFSCCVAVFVFCLYFFCHIFIYLFIYLFIKRNPIHTGLFLYSLKALDKQGFSNIFRGY